ncbi:MAG: YvrJ family protein [Armatimonadetes bacterium]|nr:YvrJ family protein [Armatimonadota bacterium]
MEDPVTQWFSNLGFPIAAYLLMYRLVTTTLDRHTQAITEVVVAMKDLRETVRHRYGEHRDHDSHAR